MMRRTMLALLVLMVTGGPLFGQEPRVVVLGVDGFDHALAKRWMDAGELPELARLASEGGFSKLRPTNPVQSPTAWASLVTGEDPGETGIFGFLRRGIRGDQVTPELALVERTQKTIVPEWLPGALIACAFVLALVFFRWRVWRPRLAWTLLAVLGVLIAGVGFVLDQIPWKVPAPRPLMGGTPFWTELDREGVAVRSLFAPMAFPAPDLENGCLLCGFGVPDALASHGTVARFSTNGPPGGAVSQMGGKHLPIVPAENGGYESLQLLGPLNPRTGERMGMDVDLTEVEGGVELAVGERKVRLEKGGAFSPFVEVTLPFSKVIDPLHTLVRYRMLDEQDAISIYQEPLQLDPRHQVPWARLTSPIDYGRELVEKYGPFETLGWASATNPLQDGLIDDETFLEDIRGLDERRSEMLLGEMKRDDWRVFFGTIYTPDRVQHMYFADIDPEHPAHDAEAAAARGPIILDSYRRIDALVGRIRQEVLREGDTLLVLSDHGFASFRRAVNLNRWLAEQDLFVAEAGSGERTLDRDLEGDALRHVDWSKTKAYALGLGRIWLAIEGREPEGIVAPEDARALKEEIRRRLLALEDGGERVVESVAFGDELYAGSRVADSADLIVGFRPGWRISWNACLGGSDEPVFFDNRSRWTGDHCSVDPKFVPGVFFSNRALATDEVGTKDLVPTLRALLGLEPRPGAGGRSVVTP